MEKERIEKTIKALSANGFNALFAEKKEEVKPLIASLMEKGSTCSVGGSMSLFDCDVFSLLRSGDYTFYDRYAEGADVNEIYHRSFTVDYYLASANAITEKGELVLIDGRGNRVAAVVYGPEKVILVVSADKITRNLREAFHRCKTVACPKNARRLSCDTYCAKNNHCVNAEYSEDDFYNAGVRGCKNTICSSSLILSRQMIKGRITVILVNEAIGY